MFARCWAKSVSAPSRASEPRELMQERSKHPTDKSANGHAEPRYCQGGSDEDAITACAINRPSWIFHGLKTESGNQIAGQQYDGACEQHGWDPPIERKMNWEYPARLLSLQVSRQELGYVCPPSVADLAEPDPANDWLGACRIASLDAGRRQT